MSVDDKKEVVMNSILKGACEYLEKPLRMDTVKFIWRHVIRKLKKGYKEAERSTESTVIGDIQMKQPIVADCVSTQHDGNSTAANSSKSLRRKKPDEDDNEVYDDVTTAKKPRVIWTVELHQKFIKAVNQIGHDSMYSFYFYVNLCDIVMPCLVNGVVLSFQCGCAVKFGNLDMVWCIWMQRLFLRKYWNA